MYINCYTRVGLKYILQCMKHVFVFLLFCSNMVTWKVLSQVSRYPTSAARCSLHN
jgi:hypothetical protein